MINEDLSARLAMNMDFARFWQVPANEQSNGSDVTKGVFTNTDSCWVNLVNVSPQHIKLVKKT